jgi:hypothetical protein
MTVMASASEAIHRAAKGTLDCGDTDIIYRPRGALRPSFARNFRPF